MSLPTKAFWKEPNGSVRINAAGSAIAHAQFTVGTTEVELTAGLANRRSIYIKPVRIGGATVRYIRVGPHNFTAQEATPVWESYELCVEAGPDTKLFAVQDGAGSDVDVRILEIGDP